MIDWEHTLRKCNQYMQRVTRVYVKCNQYMQRVTRVYVKLHKPGPRPICNQAVQLGTCTRSRVPGAGRFASVSQAAEPAVG